MVAQHQPHTTPHWQPTARFVRRDGRAVALVSSEQQPSTVYTCGIRDGAAFCTCAHFQHRLLGTRRECKHLAAAKLACFERRSQRAA